MSVNTALNKEQHIQFTALLGVREQFRDEYWLKKDPIYEDRILWRAQTFRHFAYLLPDQTILELGCGQGLLTRQLLQISRGENPITSVSFSQRNHFPEDLLPHVEFHNFASFPDISALRQFDHIIAMDILDLRYSSWLLQNIFNMLNAGGQVVFYESNPKNIMHKIRRFKSKHFGREDPRKLLSRAELFDIFSQTGFIDTLVLYNDFVYAPLTRNFIWLLRNFSIILENTPGINTLAGSLLIHARKPPRDIDIKKTSLFEHEKLRGAVSVIIPCHNEESNIEPMIKNLKSFFGEYIHEIVPIDDNSQDDTRKIIQRLAEDDPLTKPIFRSPPNGVGRAIADGLRLANGEYILTLDCDFHHLLPGIRDLFDAAADGYDVVVGSRFSRHSVLLNYPLSKIIANRGFHLLAQILFLRRFRDLTNNLKLFKREVVKKLKLTQPGFAVNAETGLQPLLMGYTVKEVPISWIGRNADMGVSSFRLLHAGGGYLQVLIRIWLKTIFGAKL